MNIQQRSSRAGSTVVILGIALVLVAMCDLGGAILSRGHGQVPAAPSSGSVAGALPALTEPLPPIPTETDWPAAARAHAAAHPGNDGLIRLAEALEGVNAMAVAKEKKALDAIIQDGWQGNQPGVAAIMQSHAAAIGAAEAAADAPPFRLPPLVYPESPMPNYMASQQIAQFLLAKARGLEAQGSRDLAAREALRALRLASRFRDPDGPAISHMIGISMMTKAAQTLESILAGGGLAPETIQAIGSQVYEMDQNTPKVSSVIRVDAAVGLRSLRRMAGDPAYRAKYIGELEKAAPALAAALNAALADLPAYAAEQKRVIDLVAARIDKPFWERKSDGPLDATSLTQNALIAQSLGMNLDELGIRADGVTAHLRLVQLQCAIGLKNDAIAKSIVDPFTGQPLKMDAARVWSLGPDGVDQGGAATFDFKNGATSAGDIVAPRPR